MFNTEGEIMENKEYVSTEVQSLIFDKSKFDEAKAKDWAKEHEMHAEKVDVTEDSIRLRQKDPGDFMEDSFRTIDISDGIKAVIGKPKMMEEKKDMPMDEEEKKMPKEDEMPMEPMMPMMSKEESKEIIEITKVFNSLKNVEVFRTGTWNGDEYSKSDLQDMVNNFNQLKHKLRPRLKLGHNDSQVLLKEDGLPAAGYVTNLYMKNNILYADFDSIPDKIFELIKTKQYNDVSVEINWNLKDENTGETFKRVLSAIALLGEEQPAVWENNPLEMFLPGELKAASKEDLSKHYNYSQKLLEEEKMKEMEKQMEELKKQNEELKVIVEKEAHMKKEKAIDDTLDGYLKDGVIVPAQKQYLKVILMELSETKKEYSFGDKKLGHLDIVKEFLNFSKPLVNLKDSSRATKPEGEDIIVRAKEYAKEHKVSFDKALLHVSSLKTN